MSSLPPLLTMSEQSSVDRSGTSCSRTWSCTTSPLTRSICSRLEPSTTTVPGSGVTSARYCVHSFLNFFYYLGFLILKNYWRGPCMHTCTHMHATCIHGCQRRKNCKSQLQLLSRGFWGIKLRSSGLESLLAEPFLWSFKWECLDRVQKWLKDHQRQQRILPSSPEN